MRVIGLIFAGVILGGCSKWPYLKQIQEAQRVDPVVVQWDRAQKDNQDCRAAPAIQLSNKGATGESTKSPKPMTDVLCPIDLDTWEFPHDRVRREHELKSPVPAYAKVTACFEQYVEPATLKDVQEVLESLRKQQSDNENSTEQLAAEIKSNGSLKDAAKKKMAGEQKRLDGEKAKGSDKQDAQVIAEAGGAVTELSKAIADLNTKISELTAALNVRVSIDRPRYKANIGHYERIEVALKAGQAAPNSQRSQVQMPFPLPADNVVCRGMRNLLQDEVLMRSEEMCRKHISDVGATNSVVNADLGLVTLLGSTLGAVVTGDTFQRVFSATASVSAGTQAIISREIYRDYVAPAISKAIIAEREKKLIEIRLEQAKNLADYTPAHAIRDAIDYHESCSFSNGLILLTTAAEKRALPSQDQVRKQITDLYAELNAVENSSKTAEGRNISEEEANLLQKTRVKLRKQIDALQERLRLLQAL